MSVASKAFTEYSLASSKQKITDWILEVAREQKRVLELASLPCHNEFISSLVEWMQSEGLKVEHKKWMDKPTGLGAMFAEDDEQVECSKWIISF